MQELKRNFSPINSSKTFGVRIGLANKNKYSPNVANEQPMTAIPIKMNMTMANMNN
jgi:hypothetical protein